jgi:hypothetical protein
MKFILEDDDDSDFILFIPGYNRARAELESRVCILSASQNDRVLMPYYRRFWCGIAIPTS